MCTVIRGGEYWVINIATNVFSYGFATKKGSGGLVQNVNSCVYTHKYMCNRRDFEVGSISAVQNLFCYHSHFLCVLFHFFWMKNMNSCVTGEEERLWGWQHVCGTEIVSSFTAIQQKPFLQNKSSACANICTTQYFAQYRKYLYHTAAHWSMTSGHLTFQQWGKNFLADITMSSFTTHVVSKFLHSYALHAPPWRFNLAYV